jgi:hypothetical protein
LAGRHAACSVLLELKHASRRPANFRLGGLASAAPLRRSSQPAAYILRQAKPGEGGRDDVGLLKPSVADPAGGSPARQRLATSRKRVLRGGGATLPAKRRQRVRMPRDRASKEPMVGAGALMYVTGSIDAPQWPGAEVPPGSESGARAQGSAQEPGRPQCLRGKAAGWATGEQRPGLAGARRPASCESESTGVLTVPPSEGERSEAGRALGSRSAPI